MKTYMMPVRAVEQEMRGGGFLYITPDEENYFCSNEFFSETRLEEKNTSTITVVVVKTSEYITLNKFIIDMFGKLGCSFNEKVCPEIESGKEIGKVENYYYGELENGNLYLSGSIESILHNAKQDYCETFVTEFTIEQLIDLVKHKEHI